MSENNVSNIFRVFLGCVLGLCCALFPVSVNAAKFGDVVDVTVTRENVGPRLDSRKAFLSSGARVTNLSYNRVTATWEGEMAGRLLGNNRSVRYPLKMKPLVGPTINAAKNLLLRNPYVFVGTAAIGALASEGFYLDEFNNQLVLEPEGVSGTYPDEYYLYGQALVTGSTSPDSEWGGETIAKNKFFPEGASASTARDYCYNVIAPSIGYNGRLFAWNGLISETDNMGRYSCHVYTGPNQISYGQNYFWWPKSSINGQCASGYVQQTVGNEEVCVNSDPAQGRPVTTADLDSLSESFWNDFVSDPDTFGVASADVDLASSGQSNFNAELGSIPSIDLGASVSTKTLANGDTEVTETSKTLDFEPRNQEGSPPEMSVKEKETTTTYVNGQLVSEEEVETEKNPSGSDGGTETEQLTGCDLFDPFCQWAEWTQRDLDMEEPDLSQFMSEFEPAEDGYTLDLGPAVCPEPITVSIAFLGADLELSYEPVCDLMSMIRPLLIATAYLFAGYIYLGVFRG